MTAGHQISFSKIFARQEGWGHQWLHPIILLWHIWTVHCVCTEHWNNKGLNWCLYGNTGALKRFSLQVSEKICWKELCQWSYIDLERRQKDNRLTSEDIARWQVSLFRMEAPSHKFPAVAGEQVCTDTTHWLALRHQN